MKQKKTIVSLKDGVDRVQLYYYNCTNCGKRRETMFKRKAMIGNCGRCKARVPKGQMEMFNGESIDKTVQDVLKAGTTVFYAKKSLKKIKKHLLPKKGKKHGHNSKS